MQHAFGDGSRVDAIVRLADGVVPIDSKFQLESYQRVVNATSPAELKSAQADFGRDFRKHVDAVRQYIRPAEGTVHFALMYMPSEGVYYEAMARGDRGLAEYAWGRKVFPASPATFFVFLDAVAFGLRGLRVQERAREIVGRLESLKGDFAVIQEDFRVLGGHLSDAQKKYTATGGRMDGFRGRLHTYHEQLQSDEPAAPREESA
jgi:DNA recombination protein RmuC